MEETFYDVIGATSSFTTEEITAAYKQRCLECHPDRGTSSSPSQFKLLQQAYSVLKDPQERHFYDRFLQSGLEVSWEEYRRMPLVTHWREEIKDKRLEGEIGKDRKKELREDFKIYKF